LPFPPRSRPPGPDEAGSQLGLPTDAGRAQLGRPRPAPSPEHHQGQQRRVVHPRRASRVRRNSSRLCGNAADGEPVQRRCSQTLPGPGSHEGGQRVTRAKAWDRRGWPGWHRRPGRVGPAWIRTTASCRSILVITTVHGPPCGRIHGHPGSARPAPAACNSTLASGDEIQTTQSAAADPGHRGGSGSGRRTEGAYAEGSPPGPDGSV